jgi:ribosome recycling factor
MVPLSQVANVSLLDSRTISVQPWEKGMGAKIEKAIRESELGLNPASMGDLIRVPMPPMSEERRKEMTKLVRHEGENAKIAMRNLRRDANEHIKKLVKDKLASEDDQKRSEADIQKVTDRHIADDRPVGRGQRAGNHGGLTAWICPP